MKPEDTYNGYANYETWAVVLWLECEDSSYWYWREAAREEKEGAPECQQVKEYLWTIERAARYRLAERLKEEVTDAAPELPPSLYSDLLGAAFDSVNWHEVAEAFLED